jgi:hypothetical protein
MPNSNAIVASVVRFEPALDRPPAELLRSERGLSVELADGRRVRLDPANPRSPGFAQLLDGARQRGIPVYLETDPTTSSITRLLFPYVARVTGIRPDDEKTLSVELHPSHARHVLRRDQPDFGELQEQLSAALHSGQPVIVTGDDAHVIIDVRPFSSGPHGPLPPLPGPSPMPRNWIKELLGRLWCFPRWPRCWFRCSSIARAQQVFNAMNATSCDPLTVPAPCIPFLYPDDGCWARASEMCRLMINMGLSPRKVWIQASTRLHANTRNNPNCFVEWRWHVAPTLCVCGPFPFLFRSMVIDPSLFSTPVTKATWKGVQGDPNASLTNTDASIYYLWGSVTDPTYTLTDRDLAFYRLALQARALQVGPPPYANCP